MINTFTVGFISVEVFGLMRRLAVKRASNYTKSVVTDGEAGASNGTRGKRPPTRLSFTASIGIVSDIIGAKNCIVQALHCYLRLYQIY